MQFSKQERTLDICFRLLCGEKVSVQKLAAEYGVSTKSITRSINELKSFLADRREFVGSMELQYSHTDKCYQIVSDRLLERGELFAVVEVLVGSRVLSKKELCGLLDKLKRFVTPHDRARLNSLIRNEIIHYAEVGHDCESVTENLWRLSDCIEKKREITVEYYRMDRSLVSRRLYPMSVMFADYYFYLVALETDDSKRMPKYFRVDRITKLTEHRDRRLTDKVPAFDEGLLRKRSSLMWPGIQRTIRFEFSGPSLQAVLDKLPTARVIKTENNVSLVEAQVYGDGIRMWLLSQGSWVKVVYPQEFVAEMKEEIEKMKKIYD